MLPFPIEWGAIDTALIVGLASLAVRWVRQVNSGLSAVVHSAQLLETRLSDNAKLCENLHNANGDRINDIIRTLAVAGPRAAEVEAAVLATIPAAPPTRRVRVPRRRRPRR